METIDLEIYQTVFDMIPVGLGIAALDGKLLIYNQAILEPGKYTREDIEALHSVLELYFDSEDRVKVLELAKRDHFVRNYPVRFKRKNGTAYHTLMSLQPVQFQDQHGWLAVVLDVDAQVKAKEKLDRKMEEIEKLTKIIYDRELKMTELEEQMQENEK